MPVRDDFVLVRKLLIHHRSLAPLALGAALGFCTVLPAVAQADWGGVQNHHSARQKHQKFIAPLAVVDSTMLLALPEFSSSGWRANTHGCQPDGAHLTAVGARKFAGYLNTVMALAPPGS